MWPELRPRPSDTAEERSGRCAADAHPDTLDLTGRECYQPAGPPYVPPAVAEAERRLAAARLDKEYLPIDGAVPFRRATAEWLFGEAAAAVQQKRLATCQCLGGSGGLRVMADFYRRWMPATADTPVYVSDPCPPSHLHAVRSAGLHNLHRYQLLDPETGSFGLRRLQEQLRAAAPQSVVVLQAGPHDPTGVSVALDDWRQLVEVLRSKQFALLLHCTGSAAFSATPSQEAEVVRLLETSGLQFTVVLSYSLPTGLYSERVGCLLVVTASPEEAVSVNGQLKAIVRPMYSNPPSHGARIVTTVLTDAPLRGEWEAQLAEVAKLLAARRQALAAALTSCGAELASRVARQDGAQAFLGLTAEQCAALERHHVYVGVGGAVPLSLLDDAAMARLAAALCAIVAA
eukprot:EG_transcript_11943